MKKLLSITIAASLAAIPFATAVAEATPSSAEILTNAVADRAAAFISSGGSGRPDYENMDWIDISDTQPAKFDLRDRGVVPSIRDQGTWGTCWGFGAIAASEISILSSLGITNKEFAEQTGSEMDLSEKHLAWFGTGHLPTLDQYAEGEYPYDATQAGEGFWHQNEETNPNNAHYNAGGDAMYASYVFANGIGPVTEASHPYQSADGSTSDSGDWTIPEEERYGMTIELSNSYILPCPSTRDADGNYVYNPAGTQAIKQQLLAGRGVAIGYYADQNIAPEVQLKTYVDALIDLGFTEEAADLYSRLRLKMLKITDLTHEQKRVITHMECVMGGIDENELTDEVLDAIVEQNWDVISESVIAFLKNSGYKDDDDEQTNSATELTEQELAEIAAAAEALGMDPAEAAETKAAREEAEKGYYHDPVTETQYVDNPLLSAGHAVCIIGWDDDYDVSNFLADHQPPANGAWIVRNSWGEGFGSGGYFYLSYYDMSIAAAEAFDFQLQEDSAGGVIINGYDNMQSGAATSVYMDTSVAMATVLPVEDDSVLTDISLMTADMSVQVTASVYLLNEGYTSPTDGILLDCVTESFEFAGYHRIVLQHSYTIPAGSVISVVQNQRTQTTEGVRYTVPFVNATGKKAAELQLVVEPLPPFIDTETWSVGIINEGESFVCLDGEWIDWKNIVDDAKASSDIAAMAEFDNLNMKAYFYNADTVNANHSFGDAQNYMGAKARICEDCGYMLIDQM